MEGILGMMWLEQPGTFWGAAQCPACGSACGAGGAWDGPGLPPIVLAGAGRGHGGDTAGTATPGCCVRASPPAPSSSRDSAAGPGRCRRAGAGARRSRSGPAAIPQRGRHRTERPLRLASLYDPTIASTLQLLCLFRALCGEQWGEGVQGY